MMATASRSPRGELVTTDVAAVACSVEPATIRQWIKRGKLTRYGTRRRAQVDLAELSDLLAADD